MNQIIHNLPLISTAAEYLDRKTGAAWKIRNAITNMVVWAANGLLYARAGNDRMRENAAMVQLATLRCWAHECNRNALTLDLTPEQVARTLGLHRMTDAHEEACRIARQKCMQRRSAARFTEFYREAIAQLEDREARKRESVEAIACLISDTGFLITGEFTDIRGASQVFSHPTEVADADLYDEDAVERQIDTLAETLGNVLESMYVECDAELAGAITTNKIQRLTGYLNGITQMMRIVGVDHGRLAARQAKLEADMAAIMNTLAASAQSIDADIEAQINAMQAPAPEPEPVKPKRQMVRAQDLVQKPIEEGITELVEPEKLQELVTAKSTPKRGSRKPADAVTH